MKKNASFVLLSTIFMLLTVLLATSPASAALRVNAMPSSVITKVNTWDSGPYTWPGNALELWGNVEYDGNQPLTYTWNFGAGEGSASGNVGSRTNIAATHTYAGVNSYIATLTVTDGTQTDSDTVYIDVIPKSLAVETNLAVQRGLKYLYMTRQNWAINGCNTYYWSGDRMYGSTGLAVLAFEDHGHREMNDPNKDIYANTVKKGLQSIFAMLRSQGAVNTVNVDSDLNGNGLKIYEGYTGGTMYEQGILSMAIANTATPDAVASCGYNATITGKTYRTILEDLVDYTAFAQEERTNWGGQGGWRYSANYGSSDNSVSQWPALGLAAAAASPFNIIDINPVYAATYPAWVKANMKTWLNNSQCKNNGYFSGNYPDYYYHYNYNSLGGFGYSSACEWPNVAKTGSGISATTFAGGGGNTINALNFIANLWDTTYGDYGNKGDHYAMYAVKKGLQYAGISTVGGHDWQQEYNQWYVSNKVNNGTNGNYWPGSVRISAGQSSTAFALLVMAPGLVELPPVANAGIDQEVKPGVSVSFNGTASKHSDPARSIVTYEWDFDYDGINFTVDATGPSATKPGGYLLPNGSATKVFTVALKVYDDSTPTPRTGIDTALVTVTNGNVAPLANPGGPYFGAVGQSITLDGSKSTDANACPVDPSKPSCLGDYIAKYQWDLNGNGIYGAADGEPEGVNPPVSFGSFIGTKTIGLKVKDSFGRSSAQSTQATTAAYSDLNPVNYINTARTQNRLTKKWTIGWKVFIRNNGNGAAKNVKASLANIPAGVTVIDGSVAWSGTIEAGETQLSDDGFSYIVAADIDLRNITWDIEFTEEDGITKHVVRGVPQGVLQPIDKAHLLTTSWGQRESKPAYYVIVDSDGNGVDEEYYPGCTTIAVGQLINYYLKNYRQGWLQTLLQGVTVYPRFDIAGTNTTIMYTKTLSGYETKERYSDSIITRTDPDPGAKDLHDFLWFVAIGLDSEFNPIDDIDDGTGAGGWYFLSSSEIYRYIFGQNKMINLLRDRFNFKADMSESKVSRLDQEKEYIIKSIDEGNPVLVTLFTADGKTGHAVVIDGYRYENNEFKLKINVGWGNRKTLDQKNYTNDVLYNTNGPVTMDTIVFSNFHVFKNTRPINY